MFLFFERKNRSQGWLRFGGPGWVLVVALSSACAS